MKKFSKELKSVYQSVSQEGMKQWKGLSIYPKDVDRRPASDFSAEEKKHLTRKGFRWYVYYRYRNPDTDKFEKQIAPTLSINRTYKKFDDRHKAIRDLKKSIKEMLEDGNSPFDVVVRDGEIVTIDKALDLALAEKKITTVEDTYNSYVIRANQFRAYLKKRKLLHRDTHSFDFRVVREFLLDVAKNSSMANRNNVLSALSSLFTTMYKDDLIRENYLKKIGHEKASNERFKTYSSEEATAILDYLEKHDPVMQLFIKFIGYNFLRPKEVVRLKVGDINVKEKTLSVWVKQGRNKTKRIPDDIINDLSKYDLTKKDMFLFCRSQIAGEWDRNEIGRRDYYTKRYSTIKKKLGYGEGYTMYSFRHTYITIGFKNLRKRLSKDKAIDELMRYTGHDSRGGINKYIHYHDLDIVDEYDGEVK